MVTSLASNIFEVKFPTRAENSCMTLGESFNLWFLSILPQKRCNDSLTICLFHAYISFPVWDLPLPPVQHLAQWCSVSETKGPCIYLKPKDTSLIMFQMEKSSLNLAMRFQSLTNDWCSTKFFPINICVSVFLALLATWFGQQTLDKYDTIVFDDSQESRMVFSVVSWNDR